MRLLSVFISACHPSPKLTASLNEIVLGINENTPMDLPANVANDYLTVTTNDIRQNSREISELNSKMNTLATKEDLKKVMDNFIDPETYKHFLLMNGDKIEADVAYTKIYKSAKKSIYLIDNYIGLKTLENSTKQREELG